NGAETQIDRDAESQARYSWKPGAARLHPGRIRELISAGQLKPEESWIQLRDFQSGAPVEAGRGSVCWNEFRQRWIMIVSSKPGEIWFAEGDTPSGPWVYARRVVSHDHYNFYNPTQHPFFDQDGGRLIYFEGTYTAAFSAAKQKTPRYDYNQIMYRLALDDARLNPRATQPKTNHPRLCRCSNIGMFNPAGGLIRRTRSRPTKRCSAR